MSVFTYDELKHHIGHHIECIGYGQNDIANVAIECTDCNEVLLDYDNPDYIKQNNDNHDLYVLFYCDAWKSLRSMKIAGIFTDMTALKRSIRKARLSGDINFDSDLDIYRSLEELNAILEFGYVEKHALNKLED